MNLDTSPTKEILDWEQEIRIDLDFKMRIDSDPVVRYYVEFKGTWIVEGNSINGIVGNGPTEDKALSNYCKRVSGKLLLVDEDINKSKALRNYIKIPKLIHTRCVSPILRGEVTLENLKDRVIAFSDEKFGKNRHFASPLLKMKDEIDEAIQNGDMFEFADCLICLLDTFRAAFHEHHTNDLITSAANKIEIMRPRIWSDPDKNGCYQHTKDIKHDNN